MTLERVKSGKSGEDIAVSYLSKENYKIIERNYRTKLGEIDIIADDKGCICFVEVRAKNSLVFGSPEDTIIKKKQHRIAKAALMYIKRFKLGESSCRFDVVCVEKVDSVEPQVKLIRNAFELDSRYSY
jgi:putative endonuclease